MNCWRQQPAAIHESSGNSKNSPTHPKKFTNSPNHQFTNYPITSIPMDRAVPATVLYAASGDSQFRSGILSFAMSSTCFRVTVPTLFLFGSFEPFARFAARFSRMDAGGVFVMNVYDRSA